MYDELARAQRPGTLERFVVNALIPSVVLTFALHEPSAAHASVSPDPSWSAPPFVFIEGSYDYPVIDEPDFSNIPDVFPVLVSMPHLVCPAEMRGSPAGASAYFSARVNVHGRIDRASIQVLQVSDAMLIGPARRALLAATFRPAWRNGKRIPAWISIRVNP